MPMGRFTKWSQRKVQVAFSAFFDTFVGLILLFVPMVEISTEYLLAAALVGLTPWFGIVFLVSGAVCVSALAYGRPAEKWALTLSAMAAVGRVIGFTVAAIMVWPALAPLLFSGAVVWARIVASIVHSAGHTMPDEEQDIEHVPEPEADN